MRKPKNIILLIACLAACAFIAGAADSNTNKALFSRATVDIGVVVSDVEKAARFYTQALGFTEVPGFEVSPQLAGDSGLNDYKAFKVRVFLLANEGNATRLKVMEVPGANSKKVDNTYISSSLGFSYLTLSVTNMAASVDRAKAAGVTPVKPPYQLGGNNYLTLLKDPDGNIIELVGPTK